MTDQPQSTETFFSINQWQRETFPAATLDGSLRHVEEEWIEFQMAPSIDERVKEAVDLILTLTCYVDLATGRGAQGPIDAKMRICRSRKWIILPDGTGRHA
jgi:hypothetical protein